MNCAKSLDKNTKSHAKKRNTNLKKIDADKERGIG